MTCNGGCALCCCCGPGELLELPDYYCRFYSTLPVTSGFNYGCSDTVRQFLTWHMTEQQADGSDFELALNADNKFAVDPRDDFTDDEDATCFISYGTLLNPYTYGYGCFTGGVGEYQDTGWKEIERVQYRCIAQGTGGQYICFQGQKWARITYDLKDPKVFITRCKVPTEGCEDETNPDLNLGDCGYLVVATVDLCYKIEVQTSFATASTCEELPGFYDEPTGTITTEDQGTLCITRSKVLESLKNSLSEPNRIWIELDRTETSDVTCCKDWLSPFLRVSLPLGKPEEWNDENFRCSCENAASLSIEGECPNLDGLTCQAEYYICEISDITVPYAAGNKWRISW